MTNLPRAAPFESHHATVTKTNSRSVPTNPLRECPLTFLRPFATPLFVFMTCSAAQSYLMTRTEVRADSHTHAHTKQRVNENSKLDKESSAIGSQTIKHFFLARLSFVRKIPSYSLYKCRAGASVANQINLLWSDKGATSYFFFLLCKSWLRSGRLDMYISLSIFISYMYIYIYIYNAVDIRKEKEVGMFMKHFSFFSRLGKQLSHLALIPLKHQENCDLLTFSEKGEGWGFDSHRGGGGGASWEERSVGDACQPKTTGHKARVTGDTGQSTHFISPLYASSMLHPPKRECLSFFFFFSFCTERMREGWCRDSCDVRAEERERERESACPLTAAAAVKGVATVGRMFRFNKGRLPTCKTTEPNKSRLRKGLAGTA